MWEICQGLSSLWNGSVLINGRMKDTPILDANGPLVAEVQGRKRTSVGAEMVFSFLIVSCVSGRKRRF